MAGVSTKKALGIGQSSVVVFPAPIIAQRVPVTTDTEYEIGQKWIFSKQEYTYMGGGTWDIGGTGPASTTEYGTVLLMEDVTLAGADNTTVPTSLATKTYADNLAIAGAPDASETVKGIAELATTAECIAYTDDTRIVTPLKLGSAFAAPPAMGSGTPAAGSFTTLAATGAINFDAGGSFESGGAAIDIGADASADAINLGTGAAARVLTIGNVTGATAVNINTGTAGFAVVTTGAGDIVLNSDATVLIDADGVLELNSSAGVIGIGNDADANNINVGTGAAARTITVGNSTGATSVVLNCGTGALNLGTNAIAHTVTLGNKTGASAVVIDVGTGDFVLDGVGASTYTVGATTTTGTVTIGGTAQTGTMTLGDSSGTNTVQIGSGEGATTVAIAGGATNAKTVTIADGAVANLVTIGSATGAASLDLLTGTGNFSLDGAATSAYTFAPSTTSGTINFGGTGANTGTMTIAGGSGAQTVNIASSTGGKTVTIADGAGANLVTIGSATGASSLDLLTGTGNFTLNGVGASTYTVGASTTTGAITIGGTAQTGTITLGDSSGTNIVQIGSGEGATTVNIAGGATAAKVVSIATGAVANLVTIGSATGAASLDLLCGTGNFTLEGGTASTYEISSTGVNTGTCKFASGTGARTVEIAGGGTGVKTINIGAAATADVITIGSTTGAGSLALMAGSGDVNVSGNLVLADVATQLEMNGGAATDFVGQATLVAGTVTVANTNIASNDRIFVQRSALNGTPALGFLVTTISAATSFTVAAYNSAGAAATTDVSSFDYWIVRQN